MPPTRRKAIGAPKAFWGVSPSIGPKLFLTIWAIEASAFTLTNALSFGTCGCVQRIKRLVKPFDAIYNLKDAERSRHARRKLSHLCKTPNVIVFMTAVASY